jgi:hypothetical protein
MCFCRSSTLFPLGSVSSGETLLVEAILRRKDEPIEEWDISFESKLYPISWAKELERLLVENENEEHEESNGAVAPV